MIEIIISLLVLLQFSVIVYFYNEHKNLKKSYDKVIFKKRSDSVLNGYLQEQLAPFNKNFNHDPQKLKFLGMPIDYICFEDDKITFIEVKTNKSKLSDKQKNIKNIILNKEVYWEEFRINEDNNTA